MAYRVINADINLQCGGDYATFKEAVQAAARARKTLPDGTRLSIRGSDVTPAQEQVATLGRRLTRQTWGHR